MMRLIVNSLLAVLLPLAANAATNVPSITYAMPYLAKVSNDNLNTVALHDLNLQQLIVDGVCMFSTVSDDSNNGRPTTYLLCSDKKLRKIITYKGVPE